MAVDMNIKEFPVIGDFDMLVHQVQGEWTTKNVKILPYMHCVKDLRKMFAKLEFRHIHRIQNEFDDVVAALLSMIQHPEKDYIDLIEIEIRDQHAYYFHIDEDPDCKPRYHDINMFLETREYLENATNVQKRSLRRLAKSLFLQPCIEEPQTWSVKMCRRY
ncbi:PREDICTED: uncharacterized protein LOC109243114 [Nicotiana attenuata]|uniref:uncharacterized protein LOC109243114 n=1 Tax=Nicotiana attenuata TaxID=49451 RepID=UPI00090582C6|nr:PREDICTED: uncharacterized protein LOC109243114 [Nicotiana attenuata]